MFVWYWYLKLRSYFIPIFIKFKTLSISTKPRRLYNIIQIFFKLRISSMLNQTFFRKSLNNKGHRIYILWLILITLYFSSRLNNLWCLGTVQEKVPWVVRITYLWIIQDSNLVKVTINLNNKGSFPIFSHSNTFRFKLETILRLSNLIVRMITMILYFYFYIF